MLPPQTHNRSSNHQHRMLLVAAVVLAGVMLLVVIESTGVLSAGRALADEPTVPNRSTTETEQRPLEPAPVPMPNDGVESDSTKGNLNLPQTGTQTTPAEAVKLEGPTVTGTSSWVEILRALLLTAIPDQYEDKKHWGKTKNVFDGVKIRGNGLDTRLSKRTKSVNHGTWHKYRIDLLDPARTLTLSIDGIQTTGAGRFSFVLNVGAKVRCTGRFEQWVLGVQGPSATIVSDATVQIQALCSLEIGSVANGKSFLPDIELRPAVQRISLFLTDIDTHKIGPIRGDLAEEIGDGSRRFVQDLLRRQEAKVVKKANAAIEKKRESLRIPASKLW